MAPRQNWSEDETILAYYYYCQIPFGRIHHNNTDIIRIGRLIGRTPSAVARKMGNLAHFDPSQKARDIVGLSHASKLDKLVVEEYMSDWESLTLRAKSVEAAFLDKTVEEFTLEGDVLPEGRERPQTIKQRVNQGFFRNAVLSSYRNRCCITGIGRKELLIASHIKPWRYSDEKTERTNPHNGLCLNALHDRAFDQGLMTVLPNHTIRISSQLTGDDEGTLWIKHYDRTSITLPDRFLPDKVFLEYHNDTIFIP